MVIQLAIRLNRLPAEIAALQVYELAEIIAVINEKPDEPDVEDALVKAFGKKP